MSYQVLARKLRPASFEALVGQDHVVRALRHALDHDQLHHAYLFTGTRGVGKTTIARILAKCLNCERGVSATPCGECSICQEVAENRFVDLIEVDAASRTRVDDTRELLENAQYLPTRGRYKVYLVDEVHMLSASSFNALLKTLEEPPEHVKFLLATTDPKKVPVTVLSRCLQFQLKNLSAEKTAAYLAEVLEGEGVTFEPAALALVARAARGSMRDALSITDQAIAFGQGQLVTADVADMLGVVGRDEIGALLDALASGAADRVLEVVAELHERAVDFDTLLAELLSALHGMAVAHATGTALEASADPAVDRAAFYHPEAVQLFYQIALMGYRDLQIAPDPRAGVEMTLLRMLSFAPAGMKTSVPRHEASADSDGPADGGPEQSAREQPAAGHTSAAASARAPGERPATAAPSELPAAPASPAAADTMAAAGPQPDASPAAAPPVDVPAPAPETRPSRVPPGEESFYELVASLELGGVARMIVEHANCIEQTPERLSLVLDHAHDTLLSDKQVDTIQRAVRERLGEGVRVEISVGEVSVETPAGRNERLRRERLEAAEAALQRNDMVRSLLTEFDGTLDEVHPLDGSQAGSPRPG